MMKDKPSVRIIYLANNWLGWKIAEYLTQETDVTIVGLILHPEEKRKFGEEIKDVFNISSDHIYDASTIRQSDVLEMLSQLNADLALSVLFGYILKPEFIELFPLGVINLHPSYLPYNRGSYPNVWSIIDETPAGVTLHYIDAAIDTGDIIAQQVVEVDAIDTGETLYHKLEIAGLDLFKDSWQAIQSDNLEAQPQTDENATSYRISDVKSIDEIDLDATYSGRELINILRARTFPPHRGAYYYENDRRINIRVTLEYDKD